MIFLTSKSWEQNAMAIHPNIIFKTRRKRESNIYTYIASNIKLDCEREQGNLLWITAEIWNVSSIYSGFSDTLLLYLDTFGDTFFGYFIPEFISTMVITGVAMYCSSISPCLLSSDWGLRKERSFLNICILRAQDFPADLWIQSCNFLATTQLL